MDWSPLWLSLKVAGWATLFSVLLGLPPAYLLARVRFPGRSLAEGLTLLPLVLPPTVLGYALLVGLGRRGALGRWLEHLGHPLVFTWQGAVVAACVASLPLFVTQARVALAGIDPDIVGAARTDGADFGQVLRFILLPLARPGLDCGNHACLCPRSGRLRRDFDGCRRHARPNPDHAPCHLRRRAVRRHPHRRPLCRPLCRPLPHRLRPRRQAGTMTRRPVTSFTSHL